MISLWTFFWLVGDELSGSQNHQPSGSNWLGVCMLVGSIQLTSPSGGAFSLCKTAQRYYVYPLIGNQDSAPKCHLTVAPLSLYPFPSLISNSLNLPIFLCVCVWPHHMTGGILVPWPGIEPMPLALESGALTTGQPRKTQGSHGGWMKPIPVIKKWDTQKGFCV